MPTIGFTTTTFTDEPTALPGLEFAIEHGFHALELSGNYLWPEVLIAAEARELHAKAARHGVSLSLHFPTRYHPGSPNDAARLECVHALRATVETGGQIGARVIVVHPGPAVGNSSSDSPTNDDRRKGRQRLVESVGHAAREAEDAGVMLCLENIPFEKGLAVRSYAEQVDVVRRIDSKAVALTLDVGHAFRSGGIGAAFRAFGPWLHHLHVHDATEDQAHLEIGRGAIDFQAHADALRAHPHAMIMEINVGGEGQTRPARGRTRPALLRSRGILRELLRNVT